MALVAVTWSRRVFMSSPMSIAIVDFGMGNLFSVQQACEKAGMDARITSTPNDLDAADGIILPGVGAFEDAIGTLERLGLGKALRDNARLGKALMGICLGMQLLMDESEEFGRHKGLGLISGSVIRFRAPQESGQPLKVPQVQWNQVYRTAHDGNASTADWSSTPFGGLADGVYMYFVHSYYVVPSNNVVCLGTSRYGQIQFCSSFLKNNIFACQFHPERSGPDGQKIYRNFAQFVQELKKRGN
jgi:glutamine amidotransferase